MSEGSCLNEGDLEEFFRRFQKLTSDSTSGSCLEEGLQHFFKILGPIFEEERRICQIKETGPTEIITPTWLEEFVEKFQEPLSAAKKAGVFCDPWEVASLCRDEVRNTKVLAWLLDCRGSHGMGSLVLKTMLSLLKKNMPQELRGVSLEDVRDFNVCLESYPDGLGNNRVDIEIESKDLVLRCFKWVEGIQACRQ